MKTEHYLAAYDRETDDFLSYIVTIPDTYLPRVKQIAHVDLTDPEAIGSYKLSSSQAHEIVRLLDKSVELTHGAGARMTAR